MIKLQLLLIMLALSNLVSSQNLPCQKATYRQFDFWIGEWEAFGPKGNKAGDSRVTLMLDSCTIFEEWTSAGTQQGLRFAGKSYNMYNAAEKKWQQYWVDNTGNSTYYTEGRFEENKMILQTSKQKINDSTWQISKMTFYNLSPEKLRQHGEVSTDDGKNWTTSFDLEYRRKQPVAAIHIDSVLRSMENAYAKKDFTFIASCYAAGGKVIGPNTYIEGRAAMNDYWKSIVSLGGSWTLTNEKTEKQGEVIWQKGVSVIMAADGKKHKVNFTLLFIKENGTWKILQDAYW